MRFTMLFLIHVEYFVLCYAMNENMEPPDCGNTSLSGLYICDPSNLLNSYTVNLQATIKDFLQNVTGKCDLNTCACLPNVPSLYVKFAILPNITYGSDGPLNAAKSLACKLATAWDETGCGNTLIVVYVNEQRVVWMDGGKGVPCCVAFQSIYDKEKPLFSAGNTAAGLIGLITEYDSTLKNADYKAKQCPSGRNLTAVWISLGVLGGLLLFACCLMIFAYVKRGKSTGGGSGGVWGCGGGFGGGGFSGGGCVGGGGGF